MNDRIPYLIAAPTMRVPCRIEETPNAYLATRAALLLLKHGLFHDGKPVGEKVRVAAFPGMGTGVGGMTHASSMNG